MLTLYALNQISLDKGEFHFIELYKEVMITDIEIAARDKQT